MQQLRAHGRRLDVGLGWFRQTRERGDAEPFVEHLGGGAGYFSMMRLYPRRGVGTLRMGNATATTMRRSLPASRLSQPDP